MLKTVEVVISGGAVQGVQVPKGIRAIIRDYDVEGVDESNTSWDIRRDSEGDLYQRMEFRHPKDEAGSKPRRATRKKPRTRKETCTPKGSRVSK